MPVKILKGRICRAGEGAGCRHFSRRMTEYPEAFEGATGEQLVPGTVNVNVGIQTPVSEHFRIHGSEINEREEFLFEVCQINGIWAYRIRPLDTFGTGGHGDHILEISCSKKLSNASLGTEVEITLFPLNEQQLLELRRLGLRGREIAELLQKSLPGDS
jgi:hypothetical protein